VKLLDFEDLKKPKRDKPLSIRLPKDCVDQLQQMAKKLGISQSKIVERLIRVAFEEMRKGKK
jgi:predicted DNA-binding protein